LSRQNKSTIYFTYKGIVWKLLADTKSSLLVVESRDEETRKVNFAAIDLETRKQLWDSLAIKETWWAGLEEVNYGYVVLHGYKDIQNPEHQGIYVFDARTGKPVWENAAYTFFSLDEEGLIAYDPLSPERVYKRFNSRNGAIEQELTESEIADQWNKDSNTSSLLQNPSHYTLENSYFEKISNFIEAFTELKPEMALDYLEHNSKIIVSFYSKVGEKMVNYLLVVNEEGDVLYNEAIGAELNGIGLDSFFMFKEQLIFVKNKKELVILGV
jgi:hypothetical protein